MQILVKAGLLGLGLLIPTLAHTQVKLGAAVPITGSSAAIGVQIGNGAEPAIQDINSSDGMNRQKLKMIVGDDGSDPKQDVSVANKPIIEGVRAVVGHFNSGVPIPECPVYEAAGVLQITLGSTNPQFMERYLWSTFRTCGRDDQQGAIAGKGIVNLTGKRRSGRFRLFFGRPSP